MTFSTLLAQLTDTHVVAPDTDEELFADNNGRLAAAVVSLLAEDPAPEAVLITGDLTNWGKPAEFEALVEILGPLTVPVLAIPGNHDDRDGTRAAFPDLPWADAEHASWVTTVGDLRILGLDSTIPRAAGARHDEGRDLWLRESLDADHDGPTILALHHPPFVTGIDWMDASGFEGLDRLRATLAEYPVDRVVCGHLHRPINASVSGIAASVGLSTVPHVALDLSGAQEVSLVHDPVGYQLLGWNPGGPIVSHTRYIDTDATPFHPGWADED
ncbi:MAG: phosphodiesterase [Acidimicrobiales bacterium]